MDFSKKKITITVNGQTMWGFIRETTSISCVASLRHFTVLLGIRGFLQVIFGGCFAPLCANFFIEPPLDTQRSERQGERGI
jgi:hypothetical protein